MKIRCCCWIKHNSSNNILSNKKLVHASCRSNKNQNSFHCKWSNLVNLSTFVLNPHIIPLAKLRKQNENKWLANDQLIRDNQLNTIKTPPKVDSTLQMVADIGIPKRMQWELGQNHRLEY